MKRLLLAIIILLSCLVVQAEHNYDLFNTLNSNQDYHYTANSHITLLSGFRSEPRGGHEVLLDIDSYSVTPPQSGITGGSTFNNTGGVVGSLQSVVDVSLLGGAIYSIPIPLPEGLGGITPQLNITYNSQSHNGLLGWAWDLSGISSITRTGKTNYHDGTAAPVNYSHDRFCLDGQRLLKVGTGSYGDHGTSYRTEQDQLCKVISYHESGISGPSYFKVWTADGRIYHYGSSEDSKALVNSQHYVSIWLLKKVEDGNGNSMEYHYCNESNTFRLTKITYSKNHLDNINAAFSVEFQYNQRDDIDVSYVGDCFYIQNKILSGITVKSGAEPMYSYQFKYKSPNPKKGYPYHFLTEINLSAGDEHLNPTKIQWGNNNYDIGSGTDVRLDVTTNGINNAFVNAVKFSGDFNGDGYSDVVAARPNSQNAYTTADVFINKGVNGDAVFDHLVSLPLSSNINWIHVGDFNGDGLDDILLSNRTRTAFPLPDHISGTIHLSQKSPSGAITFNTYQTPTFNVPHSMVEAYLIGDFFGDGKSSILIQSVTDDKSNNTTLLTYNESNDQFQLSTFNESLYGNRFYPADYNGDGITEILYKNANGRTSIVRIIKNDEETYHFSETFTGSPTNWDDCFPGDFNGDGLTDALFYSSNSSTPWNIQLSSQLGISSTSYALPETFPYSSPGNYMFSLDNPNHTSQYIKTADFDGDGCADIGLYKDNLFYVFYGPIRANTADAPFANSQRISAQLFGNYDNMSACLGNFLGQEGLSYLGNNTLSHLPQMTKRHEVQKITDGFGRMTAFTFDYLMPKPSNPSENDFYRLVSSPSNLSSIIHCVAVPVRALRKITTYNIKNKPVETLCFYEGCLLHTTGKGFLGFSKTRQDDYCNNQLKKKTIRQYDITRSSNTVHLMTTSESVYDKSDYLAAKSSYSNTLFTHCRNSRVFVPISDKTLIAYDVDNPSKIIKKEIEETTVSTYYSTPNKYDDVISVVSQIKGVTDNNNVTVASDCEFQNVINTTYVSNNIADWLINRPATTTSTFHRKGNYDDISHHRVFTYCNDKPFLINTMLDIPNDGSDLEDRLTKLTALQYDPTGNVISKTISTPNDSYSPRTETFEYSKTYGRRLLTKHTNALNQSTNYSYDPVYNYCTSITDCNGFTTQNEQDPFGVTCTTSFPDGTTSCKATRWGSSYYYLWEKRTGQETKETHYDIASGNIIQQRSYDINGALLLTDYTYDDLGRLTERSLPRRIQENPKTIVYQYDSHNRIKRITHPDGTYETIQHNGNKTTTSITGHDGSRVETKVYNPMGWLTSSTDAMSNTVVYDYYADGKPKWLQIKDKNETKIEMAYDALGNRISLNDPDYGVTTCEYNAFSELTKSISANSDETDYDYDILGRPVSRMETNHTDNTTETTEWIYGQGQGQNGLLLETTSPNHTIHYEYDDQLRLSKITENILGTSYQTHYTYDNASKITSITYPSGFVVNHYHTSEGYLKSITDSQSKTLWKVSEANALMQPTKIITGNGSVSLYDYDENTYRLTSIHTTLDDKVIQDYTYQYNDYSNMTHRDDRKNGHSESFTYDMLNRLKSVTGDDGSSQFSYDAYGRMTNKTGPDGYVFYHADYSGPRPHAIKSAEASPGVFPQSHMALNYTTFDKISTINEGNDHVSFLYGCNHQRIKTSEHVHGVTREKIYVGNCEFIATRGSAPVVRTFLSGPTGVFAVAETIGEETRMHYVHKDHLSSWTTITDSMGNIEQKNCFDAWGYCKNSDKLMFDRGYTGHEHIKGMGLINMNGRLYDPVTSSMLSPDNNIQMPEYSQNLNRYAYCFNNPLTYTDPDGNTALETAMLLYLTFCTDFGYEMQKYTAPLATRFDLHLSSQQLGVGLDCSVGLLKSSPVAVRFHGGGTYYWKYYDNSYRGMEYRAGMEWCFLGFAGISGTKFRQGDREQITNALILGDPLWSVTYENDYMFHLGDYLLLGYAADGGDRYRSAAARIRIGPNFQIGVNLFTGDPGLDGKDRRTTYDPDVESPYYDEEKGGRETYTLGINGDNPDEYRAGVFYVGYGPIKVGGNSEQIRNRYQNQFAHDKICAGDSPYFKVLDRPGQFYFYFGTGTGNSLW